MAFSAKREFRRIPPGEIKVNPYQPRQRFSQGELDSLADSIRRYGIITPLTVRRMDNGYELIAGERRLRAAQLAGLTEIPCIIMNMDQQESGVAAMIENLQRQDLDFIEEARGIQRLMEKWNISQEQAAKFLGKSQSAVANKLRLLKHSQPVLDELRRHGLTERHARALLKLPSENQKMAVIATIVQLDMNVARTEQYIDSLLQTKTPREKRPNVGAFIQNLTQALSKIQLSGISAVSERRETENEIVLTITFPK